MKQAILTELKIRYSEDITNYGEIGIKAVATIYIPSHQDSYKIQTIESGGIWGISEDINDDQERKEIAEEQLEELKEHLQILNVHISGNVRLFPKSEKNTETTKPFDVLAASAIKNNPEYV